jgi:membrane fusion protein, heavy metal efflux system
MKTICLIILLLTFGMNYTVFSNIQSKDIEGHELTEKNISDEHGENEIELTAAAVKAAEIKTKIAKIKQTNKSISIPGEIIPDPGLYTKVSVRISCQVEKLWVSIGDYVKKDQPLVTLSSIEMAEIQAQLLNSYNDWRRLKPLVTKKAVSEREYKKSEIELHKLTSILISYGMTKKQVLDLLKTDDPSKITGSFILLSPQSGKVYTDNLELGKRFVEDKEDGNELISIIDDSTLWIKASLHGNNINQVKKGAKALITNSRNKVAGKVIQIIPKLNPVTRTQNIIISLPNKDDKLHPGEFVDCNVELSNTVSGIIVPESSTFRLADGDWVIYEEEKPNHYKQHEVSIIENLGKNVLIKGIEEGSKIVTKGAFALHSEFQKNSFSVHNH